MFLCFNKDPVTNMGDTPNPQNAEGVRRVKYPRNTLSKKILKKILKKNKKNSDPRTLTLY